MSTRTLMERVADLDERGALMPLLTGTADASDRETYVRWLLHHRPEEGRLLTLANRLATPGAPASTAEERAELLAFRAQADADWWRLVGPPVEVRHCGQAATEPPRIRFAYECPRGWETLEPTGSPDQRGCDACNEVVTWCRTIAEAEAQARRGACIAVDRSLVQSRTQEALLAMVGRPNPVETWARLLFEDER